jgi:hypothetical protein
MNVADEFKTVELVLASEAETRAIDALALSLIKAEKQARRLVTFLVYQHAWCDRSTVPKLKSELERSKRVYFDGLLRGWDALYPRSISDLVGHEYKQLRGRMSVAVRYRNKIFHGQLTAQGLSRIELLALVGDIRKWCEAVGTGATAEVGYDGCGRNSFRKASNSAQLSARFKSPLANMADYTLFIETHMERKPIQQPSIAQESSIKPRRS